MNVVPCIVVNGSASALSTIDGVPVVDRYILRQFFGEGREVLGPGATHEPIRFYSNDAEAAAALAEYLKDPPHLRHYRDAVAMATRWQIDCAQPDKRVGWVYPEVQKSRGPGL